MMVALSAGNTNTFVGLYRDGEVETRRIPTGGYRTAGELLALLGELPQVEGAAMASVAPEQTDAAFQALERLTGRPPLLIAQAADTGLDLSAYDARLLGTDRAVCCVGAAAKYPAPLVVCDLGTATSVSVLDGAGAFAGGMILPGVRMGLEALARGTALLPQVTPQAGPLIGGDTAQCLASGALYGTALALEGYGRRVSDRMGREAPLIFTGGNAPAVLPCLERPARHEPSLLLDGLRVLYERYKRQTVNRLEKG